ncbi:MAG TPA: hypothetical protein VD948_11455 [Rhodothermales bacterium]|nr:hypothetical protein [Rhodothermales bacterium]
MLSSDQLQRLTRIRQTAPGQTCECSLFYNPSSGQHRVVVRDFHQDGADWRPVPKQVIPVATPEQVAELFEVDPSDAELLLNLAREEATTPFEGSDAGAPAP